jgi:hypothetical protein
VAFVYFIQQEDKGPIKIGLTEDILSRLVDLQVGNPHDLYLRAFIRDAGHEIEVALHKLFSADRIRGEWFGPSRELRKLIESLVGSDHLLSPRKRKQLLRRAALVNGEDDPFEFG